MSAELSARRIAAEAALADFRREDDAFMQDQSSHVPVPSYGAWAARLANALGDLLAWLEVEDGKERSRGAASWVGPDGAATLTAEDIGLVVAALRAAIDIADSDDRHEIAALLFRLGDVP